MTKEQLERIFTAWLNRQNTMDMIPEQRLYSEVFARANIPNNFENKTMLDEILLEYDKSELQTHYASSVTYYIKLGKVQ
jgi:hypothetical protein